MADRPNLLFLFTDEQRVDTMGCYGNQFIQTPHLSALAAQSTVFENAYCTQPVCTPSRATLLTGLYPHGHGCISNNTPLPASAPTVAELVPRDYRRGYIGKWHLGDEVIAQRGFEEWISVEDNYRAWYSQPEYLERLSDYHHYLVGQGLWPQQEARGAKVFGRRFAAELAEEQTKAAFVGREAGQFIRSSKDQPFALYVNFLEPHMPFTGPLNDLYDPAAIPVGPEFGRMPAENCSRRNRDLARRYITQGFEGVDLSTEAGWRTLRARYYGLVTMVDRAIGGILQALEESGQASNTIVVFTSDHGEMMGDHCLLAKGVMYEESIRVPLLVRVPWLSASRRRVAGRVSQVDLAATLLDLMGLPAPGHMHGRSRRDAMEGRADLRDNPVVVEWNSPARGADEYGFVGQTWRSIVWGSHKLNLCDSDDCELFDLGQDPFEARNVLGDPRRRARVRQLVEAVEAWQAQTGDRAALPRI